MDFSLNLKRVLAVLVLLGIVATQYFYDLHKPTGAEIELSHPSLQFVRAMDLGLHSAAADYYWVEQAITELPFLTYGFAKYNEDLEFVNNLDPRFSFPYYWTVLLLPNLTKTYPDAINAALTIGERGVREADPDWRVPFYLAADYYIYKHDRVNAAKNFDLAAQAPNAPYYIKRFSENYNIATSERSRTREVWKAINQSSDDPELKKRAEAYLVRLDIFDFLEQAARLYKQKYGRFPRNINNLVSGGILKAIPPDPFGFQFNLDNKGGAGIVKD